MRFKPGGGQSRYSGYSHRFLLPQASAAGLAPLLQDTEKIMPLIGPESRRTDGLLGRNGSDPVRQLLIGSHNRPARPNRHIGQIILVLEGDELQSHEWLIRSRKCVDRCHRFSRRVSARTTLLSRNNSVEPRMDTNKHESRLGLGSTFARRDGVTKQ